MEILQSLNNILIIGIAGGTGSGKTYLTNKLIQKFGTDKIATIPVDSYYHDLSHLPIEERAKNNFDHPASFDFDLLKFHIKELKKYNSIEIPRYDYKTHTRMNKTNKITNSYKIIIIEGIYALYNKKIRNYFDYSVFIDVPSEKRKTRRLDRDVKKRARTIDSILTQYNKYVTPMFEEFIKPTIHYADLVIKNFNNSDTNFIKLTTILNKNITNDKK